MGCNTGHGVLNFLHGLLREPDGSPSMTRVFLAVFGCFSMWVIWRVIWHVVHLSDPAQLGIWLSNFPLLIGALIAFTSLPYTVNKGTGAFSDLGGMIAQMKNPQVQSAVAAAAQQATGSNQPKG